QAEDGIRDATVTGVQTCALPIFPARVAPVHLEQTTPPASGSNPARPGGTSEPHRAHAPSSGANPADSSASSSSARSRALLAAPEIGRASCRERVWGAGGGADGRG